MFDREALELIQKTAVQAAQVETVLDGKVIVVPTGVALESAERYSAGRFRFRGTYRTNTLAELIAYITKRGPAFSGPCVFVDAESGKATAYFNLGDEESPGHGDDTALLNLKLTAGYSAMLAATVSDLSQKQLAAFLEDWADQVSPLYVAEEGETLATGTLTSAIAAIRDITITKASETTSVEKELAASASAFASVEAKSRNRLPAGFRFLTPPYDGFEYRSFTLRLSVSAAADKAPRLALRIVGLSDVQEKIAQEFEAKIRDGLAGVPVYRGTFTP